MLARISHPGRSEAESRGPSSGLPARLNGWGWAPDRSPGRRTGREAGGYPPTARRFIRIELCSDGSTGSMIDGCNSFMNYEINPDKGLTPEKLW